MYWGFKANSELQTALTVKQRLEVTKYQHFVTELMQIFQVCVFYSSILSFDVFYFYSLHFNRDNYLKKDISTSVFKSF